MSSDPRARQEAGGTTAHCTAAAPSAMASASGGAWQPAFSLVARSWPGWWGEPSTICQLRGQTGTTAWRFERPSRSPSHCVPSRKPRKPSWRGTATRAAIRRRQRRWRLVAAAVCQLLLRARRGRPGILRARFAPRPPRPRRGSPLPQQRRAPTPQPETPRPREAFRARLARRPPRQQRKRQVTAG